MTLSSPGAGKARVRGTNPRPPGGDLSSLLLLRLFRSALPRGGRSLLARPGTSFSADPQITAPLLPAPGPAMRGANHTRSASAAWGSRSVCWLADACAQRFSRTTARPICGPTRASCCKGNSMNHGLAQVDPSWLSGRPHHPDHASREFRSPSPDPPFPDRKEEVTGQQIDSACFARRRALAGDERRDRSETGATPPPGQLEVARM